MFKIQRSSQLLIAAVPSPAQENIKNPTVDCVKTMPRQKLAQYLMTFDQRQWTSSTEIKNWKSNRAHILKRSVRGPLLLFFSSIPTYL